MQNKDNKILNKIRNGYIIAYKEVYIKVVYNFISNKLKSFFKNIDKYYYQAVETDARAYSEIAVLEYYKGISKTYEWWQIRLLFKNDLYIARCDKIFLLSVLSSIIIK